MARRREFEQRAAWIKPRPNISPLLGVPPSGSLVSWLRSKVIGGFVFSLKRKGDFRLQLTRTLKQPGRHKIELYLFTPHESNLSAWTVGRAVFL